MLKIRTLLLIAGALATHTAYAATGTIGASAATPSSVAAGAPTTVTFTSVISAGSVLASSVNLQQVNSLGQSTVIGQMYDDGTHGDAVAHDGKFTLQFALLQQTPGALSYRVSAAFQGSLTRALSAPIVVNVTGTGTAITINSPAEAAYLSVSPTVVTGSVMDPAATVSVNGLPATVSGGSYHLSIPLREGSNKITAVALNSNGVSATATENITLDTTPPHVTISAPAVNAITDSAMVNVSGIVNDIVVGTVNSLQATVVVNGVPAQVSNRTYVATSVPLQIGPNTIQATATDRAGNFTSTAVTVTRIPTGTQSTLRIISGDSGSGPIKTVLSSPLHVQAVNAAGLPLAGVPVVFQVVKGDGSVGTGTTPGMSSIAVNTDAQGSAQANLILGSHAGAGNQQVQASAVGIAVAPIFTESATTTGPALIVVDSGGNQSGVVGQSLPLPFIAVVTDAGHNRLPNIPVSFTVAQGGGTVNGRATINTTSDSDGRVQAVLTLGPRNGISNNVVNATFPGNPGLPSSFTATAYLPGPASGTAISGTVLDNSNQPIPGVTMRLYQVNSGGTGVPQQVVNSVTTDAAGFFQIQPAPVGLYKLMADGTTATSGGPFPTLEYDIVTVSGQNITVGQPIYLQQLRRDNELCVSPTVGGTLTIPEAPGFALKVDANTAVFPGGSRTGCISVTPVNMDKVPMVPGFGQQPRFIVTIQPVGTIFTTPAQLTIPNVDGLQPRAVTEMYSYDHDLASFVAIGTGTVSADGSVITSDPGVGVIKAGWHCGGDPNVSGSVGSLGVTLTAAAPSAGAGTTVNMTAMGTPPLDGEYINWQVVDDPADPNDDPTAATFVTTPNCPSQASCVAQLMGLKPGIVSLQVTFRCTTTGATITSAIVKVTFALSLMPKEVSFSDDITILKDLSGSANPIMDPVWKDTNAAADNDAVGYVQGSTMKVTVKFAVSPVPTSPISGITITGEIPGLGKFIKTGVTIPAAAEVTVSDITADTPLPANMTKFYNPMTINWKHMNDGDACPKCTSDGSTANKVYVTLATPLAVNRHAANIVYLTSLNLAVSNDGATNQQTAFAKSWDLIKGPANIQTWDSRPLYYYRDGVGFSGCALDEEQLLTATNGSGQCGSFALLLIGVAAVNGVPAQFVSIGTVDHFAFLVRNWTFGAPSYPKGTPGQTPLPYSDFQWKLVFNATGDPMVPKQPANLYGDMTNLTTLPGQNSAPPSEKDFGSHYIVKVTVNPPMLYYDPSYGVTYAGAGPAAAAASFETNAVTGYYGAFPGDPAGWQRLRKPGGAVNITFDK